MYTGWIVVGQVLVGAATILGMVLMGYYAIGILESMRHGVLEKGWRLISIAVFFFIFGELTLDASVYAPGPESLDLVWALLGFLGAALLATGGFIMAYGFKAHHDAWHPRGLSQMKEKNEK